MYLERPSIGKFTYAQNVLHGWTQVHVDVGEFRVVTVGVDPFSKKLVELYGITIKRG